MSIIPFVNRISLQKILASFLVFALILSQTIRFDILPTVQAKPDDYRDIVSIIVDKNTYSRLRGEITDYAKNIQSYLGSARTTVVLVDEETTPAMIARENEKLYYEGDGWSGKSQLVGTILIGNVPIPMVNVAGKYFPSLFPYVDFENKTFIFNEKSERYEESIDSQGNRSVEIWHWVINPRLWALDSSERDEEYLKNFFQKTNDFYAKTGKYTPNNEEPRVLYFDSFNESKSIDARSLYQYELFGKNIENIAYNRFTKHLVRDVNKKLNEYDKENDAEYLAILSGANLAGIDTDSFLNSNLTEDMIKDTPDIHTESVMMNGLLKGFNEVFNKKVLGENLAAVHNAGRYNSGATVNADLVGVKIALMDEEAMKTLRKMNDLGEVLVNNFLEKEEVIRKIPILDSMTARYGSGYSIPYANYFFWNEGKNIQNASQCTIARGFDGDVTEFGKSVRVEANMAFDVNSTQNHIDTLENENATRCLSEPLAINTYWGGNSILRLANDKDFTNNPLSKFPNSTQFQGFTRNIFSLGGMLESSRIANPSLSQCMDYTYQYTLTQPYRFPVVNNSDRWSSIQYITYPTDTDGTRFACRSQTRMISADATYGMGHILRPNENIFKEFDYYDTAPCLYGSITIDGQKTKTATRTCISRSGSSSNGTDVVVDNTHYRELTYHLIDGRMHHISPTDEEIAVATENGATQNIPVNIKRSVEFLTKKGNIATIEYPNIFGGEITDENVFRGFAKKVAESWWKIYEKENSTPIEDRHREFAEKFLWVKNDIRAMTEEEILQKMLEGVNLPVDQNTFFAEVLSAKKWLSESAETKYQRAMIALLSESGNEKMNAQVNSQVPYLANNAKWYEIAYLGLGPLSATSEIKSQWDFDDILQNYNSQRSLIDALNVALAQSRQNTQGNNPNNSDKCAPPEWVNIFQWPQAITCWMKSQFPMPILAGKCSAKTIGDYPKNQKPNKDITLEADIEAQKNILKNATVVGNFPKTSFGYHSTLTFYSSLESDTENFSLPVGSTARVQIVSVQNEKWENIEKSHYNEYIDISENPVSLTGENPQFIINSRGKHTTAKIQIIYSVVLLDGSRYDISSDIFDIKISSEFLDISLRDNGKLIGKVFVNDTLRPELSVLRKKDDYDIGIPEKNFSFDIYDDISSEKIFSNIEWIDGKAELPQEIFKNTGNYRIVAKSGNDISGEYTFVVHAGKLEKISLLPVSSAMMKDSENIVALTLSDTHGNAVSPDLYSVELSIENGVIIDNAGNPQSSLKLDIFDSAFTFTIKATGAGEMKIRAKVDYSSWNEKISKNTEETLKILESLSIKVEFEGVQRVGADPVRTRISVLDNGGNPVVGFNSVITLSLPNGAGYFNKNIIDIRNGRSEIFEYTPGKIAGKHNLTVSIPGIGILENNPITLLAGDPMMITHSNINGRLTFLVTDRHGNIADFNGKWQLSFNGAAVEEISFQNGVYTTFARSGKYILNIPELQWKKFSYNINGQVETIEAISLIAVQIIHGKSRWETIFAPDYNAQYTVLAGGSFLPEAKNILFAPKYSKNADGTISDGGNELGRSLAVSTLLDSPYADETLVSIFPNGGYSLGVVDDAIIDASVSIERGFPVLVLTDAVRQNLVGKILYSLQNADFQHCKKDDTCKIPSGRNTISAKLLTENTSGFEWILQGEKMILTYNKQAIFSVAKNGQIQKDFSVQISPKKYDTTDWFVMEIIHQGTLVSEMIYKYAEKSPVELTEHIFASDNYSAPVLQVGAYQVEQFSDKIFEGKNSGLKIQKSSLYQTFDPQKTWPNSVDDIGTLSENAGVGWAGNNRMMLSYAAGDSVGEATKWFHTYMFVNLWDPVSHVDTTPGHVTQFEWLDRSVGELIASGRHTKIEKFFQKDMNADGKVDIVIQYIDGYIGLLLNLGDRMHSVGNISYLSNFDNWKLEFGDFQWDGYADMISVDKNGKLSLISNNDRKFISQDIVIENTLASVSVPFYVSQMKIYDMDNDGKDDIVYLTAGGELGILYGSETSGKFVQKILDSTLGLTLSDEVERYGGAFKSSSVKQFPNGIDVANKNSSALTDSFVNMEVYYQVSKNIFKDISSYTYKYDQNSGNMFVANINTNSTLVPTENENTEKYDTYIKSQYASLAGVNIEKRYSSTSQKTLLPNDKIQAEIIIKNTSNADITDAEYLDTIAKIFTKDDTMTYTLEVNGSVVEKKFQELAFGDYDIRFEIGKIPASGEVKIRYTLKVLPTSYGEILVWDFEKWLVGHDNFGDISFKTSTTCGAEAMNWLSTGAREYNHQKSDATFTGIPLPDGIADKLKDENNNGIPDYTENITPEQGKQEYKKLQNSSEKGILVTKKKQDGSLNITVDIDQSTASKLNDRAQELVDGLACGFGGGSCMSFPINWAPLAPGSDPVVFGTPVGDGLKVDEGLPVFSALTTKYTKFGPIPVTWPPSSIGAGWYFWENAPYSSFVRIFVTPTLTLGMGAAVCMGSRPSDVWNIPPKWLFPLIKWGNCIVMAKPMPICKGDWSKSDGDVSAISGLVGANGIGATNDVWNGKSCSLQINSVTEKKNSEKILENEIIDYMKNPSEEKLSLLSVKVSKREISSLNSGPIFKFGNSSLGADELEVSIDSERWLGTNGLVNTKNRRIAAFPDFVMDWLSRQTDEIVNSLLSPPNLTIIPPTNLGQNATVNGTYADFFKEIENSFSEENLKNMQQSLGQTFSSNTTASQAVTDRLTTGNTSNTRIGAAYNDTVNGLAEEIAPMINSVWGGLDTIRAAYSYLGKMPFLSIRQQKVNVNVPWIMRSELEHYENKLKEYERTIDRGLEKWCLDDNSAECLEKKAQLQNGWFMSSLRQNIKRIEEYKNFPDKLQKYVTWKERLLYEILCNVEAVEEMTTEWIHRNGLRFQRWAELYVLIKAIAESWQPILDIFANTSASCGVCRNERYNSQYWKFKLISMIIPQVPVIQFPKWPDIVLDLSDVRLGIRVLVPDFQFRLTPIRLPDLPSFSLPNSPNLSFTLPTLPVLPKLPELPDLPNIPSLPTVKLPDLPPPPKLPKIAGSVKATLDILRLISKMYCYYQKTVLIPEWQVGDVIAQRTERQGTLSMDFLDVQLPQFSLPHLKEIRISTHVNFVMETKHLLEMAKQAVKPINEFSTDLANKAPASIEWIDNAANSLQNAINNAGDAIHEGADAIENSADNIRSDIQNQSDNINNTFRETENNLQNTSDNIENSVQDAVDNSVSFEKDFNNLLDPIIQKFEKEKDIFLDNDEFYTYLKNELIAAGQIAWARNLDAKMFTAKKEAEILISDIKDYNTKRFNLLRQYLDEEKKNVGEMQNIIDMLRSTDDVLLAKNFEKISQFTASDEYNNSRILSELETLEIRALESIRDTVPSTDLTAKDIADQLSLRVKRIAQYTPTEVDARTTQITREMNNGLSEYLPRFEWMYILTEKTNTQTKLFDYTELITERDRVVTLDIDSDNDRDYLYLLGGDLYLKRTYLENEKPKILDLEIFVKNIDKKNPEVANNFRQLLSLPSEMNISFQNTVSNEKEWRMEFYDAYIEWDNISVNPKRQTPKTIVDLFVHQKFENFENGIRKLPVARSLRSGQNLEGFKLEWPKISKISGENNFFSIEPNRTFYTPNRDVNISYRNTRTGNNIETMRLLANHGYQFEVMTEIRTSETLYVIENMSIASQIYTHEDNLEGLPILPGMKIFSEKAFTINDLTHGEDIQIFPNSLYIAKNLGNPSEQYTFSLPYPNGYYYARLYHLSDDKRHRTGVTLMSPQLSSDSTSPVISLAEFLQIPVYATTRFNTADIITEFSKFSLEIDENIATDSDENGIFDDDFTYHENVKVTDSEIIFGPFTAPERREMLMKVKDEFGNTTLMPLSVEIFTPIPELQNAKHDTLSGKLSISVADEPIDIFRIRASETPSQITEQAIISENTGNFATGSLSSEERIFIKTSNASFNITPTGIIENLPINFSQKISSATQNTPMSIDVYDEKDEKIYSQFISLPQRANILNTHEVTHSEAGNLMISPSENILFTRATSQDTIIPGGVYITDNSYQALLAIARDGNIYTLDNSISLALGEKDGFILISAFKWGQKIADFHYQMKFFYTTK